MSQQAEFVKSVRDHFAGLQTRFGSLNTDARKAFERVRDGEYKTRVEGLSRKVKEAQGRAASYVDSTSRGQAAVVVAENLRKVASRIDQLASKVAPPSSSPDVH